MGMLSNLGKSIKKSLGMTGPSGEELQAKTKAAYAAEQERLKWQEEKRLAEGKRQAHLTDRLNVGLTFGDRDRMENIGAERRQLRATGRFQEDRLIL